jgi:hypothetical protein
VRRGELPGEAKLGRPPKRDSEVTFANEHAAEDEATRKFHERLRKLAGAKDRVVQLLATAADADQVTRSCLIDGGWARGRISRARARTESAGAGSCPAP